MLVLHTSELAILLGEHVRVGAVRVACGQGLLSADDIPVDAVPVSGGGGAVARRQQKHTARGPVPAVRRALVRPFRGGDHSFE